MTRGRPRFQGTLQILRYNWGAYVLGVGLLVGASLVLSFIRFPLPLLRLGWLAIGLGAWWLVASILASFWIYDASDLMDWGWLASQVGEGKKRWVNLHAGLDESTPELALFFGPPMAVIDFFDRDEMTEKSISRARAVAKNAVTAERARYDSLPVSDDSAELVLVIFSAHELRSPLARSRFFRELARICEPGGKVVVVEHLRDFPNLVAFGPGFLHFLALREWLVRGRESGLHLVSQAKMTPFVRLLAWEREGT